MNPSELEHLLLTLPQHGQCVKRKPYRQVWRLVAGDQPLYLKFYPHPKTFGGKLLRKFSAGGVLAKSPAQREFKNLQALQKAGINAPRAIGLLNGFVLSGIKGDAVLMYGIEPAVSLDELYRGAQLAGRQVKDHRLYVQMILELCRQLVRAGLGHEDLHLANMLIKNDKLFLLDAYALQHRPLSLKDLQHLAHSTRAFATTTDICRAWNELGPGGRPPMSNPVSKRLWRKFSERAGSDNQYFATEKIGDYDCRLFLQAKPARRWSRASQQTFTTEQWQQAFDLLLKQIQNNQLKVLKQSASSQVWAAHMRLGQQTLEVVAKRSLRRYWWRWLTQLGRGSRSGRAWKKSWALAARNIPTAWPLLLAEKRRWGFVVDQLLVCERVPGTPLSRLDLDSLDATQRENLFRRCGRLMRLIESHRWSHFDAKSSNILIMPDDVLGPTPVLVDVDGVRFYPWSTFAIRRLLKSMKEHKQYTPADSMHLCLGYAPYARLSLPKQPVPTPAESSAQPATDETDSAKPS